MINKTRISQALPFYLFAAGVFLIIMCQDLFSHGMFMDGLIYSTISKNLANGVGTFWNPQFTLTCMPDFHEHPPLAFGIQSIFYTLLGESRYIDKFYSLLTFIIVGYILLKIWTTLGYKHGWFPLLLWFLTPTVSWACCNNMLENTLTIFTSLSVLFYLKSQNSKRFLFVFFAGIMLGLGFLTKGFVAFFPWTFPLLLWVLLRQKTFAKISVDSIAIFIFTVVPLLLLIILFPVVKLSLHKYLDTQVINSLRGVVTVDSRLYIIKRLFSELIPAVSAGILLIFWNLHKKFSLSFLKENYKTALVFILFGLTGVLPVMISMKQSGFYILAVYPFFSIGIGILFYPLIDYLVTKIDFHSSGFLFFKWLSYGIFILGIVLTIYFSDGFSRDKNKISDISQILPELTTGSTINIDPDLNQDWSLHGYFNRFKSIILDPDIENKRDYLLIKKENYSDTLVRNYEIVNLKTIDYELLKKK
jgi:4-amino-4-deoxy-L-arabinose transferase-like glycosyltransferase